MKYSMVWLGVFTCATVCWAGEEKLAPALRGRGGETVDVIVRYKQAPTEAQHQRVVGRGGRLQHRLSVINANHYAVPGTLLEDLANDPEVDFISPNRPVYAYIDQAATTIGANLAASYNVNGAGVGVAVIDSGIGVNDDLSGRVVYERNFTGGASQDLSLIHI